MALNESRIASKPSGPTASWPIILPASDWDRDAVLAIRNHPAIVTTTISGCPVPEAEHRAWWERVVGKTMRIWTMRFEEYGPIIAYGRLQIEPDDQGDPRSGLISLAVLPQFQGERFGSRLLDTILINSEQKIRTYWADIQASNWRSIRLFASRGFRSDSTYRAATGLIVRWKL